MRTEFENSALYYASPTLSSSAPFGITNCTYQKIVMSHHAIFKKFYTYYYRFHYNISRKLQSLNIFKNEVLETILLELLEQHIFDAGI